MKQQYKTFLIWALWVGIAFFSVYPTMNWITHLRHEHYQMYWGAELAIPFVPQFIWIYLSLYLLFATPPFFLDSPALTGLGKRLVIGTVIGGLLFIAFPAELGFIRTAPNDSFYKGLFTAIFNIDYPHNLVPSLHVFFSAAIVFPIVQHNNKVIKSLFWVWLIMISSSTILVHQHHLIDVASGVIMAVVLHFLIKEQRTEEVS